MKTIMKLCYFALAFTVMFTLNSCSNDELLPQNEELSKTVNDNVNAKMKVASASGQAGLNWEQGEGGFNGHQSFSFHASMDAEGNVSGSWQSNYNDSGNNEFDINTHGTIECITFVGDNRATMSGTVTSFNAGEFWDDFELDINDKAYFEVIDNGEGSKSDPDQFSDVFVALGELFCGDFNVALLDINNGNIQVKN